MNPRLVIFLGLACFVTFALFWIMQALVSVQGELKEGGAGPSIEFVRLKRDSAPEIKKREAPKRQKPDAPPPPPDISSSKSNFNPGEGVGDIVPDLDPTGSLDGGIGTGAGSDRGVVPLVQIQPDYPLRARQRGIEGWVTLRFTVTATGAVKDAVVMGSRPRKIFDKAALQAIRRWKFQPKIKNGAPVEQKGQQYTLEFTMED